MKSVSMLEVILIGAKNDVHWHLACEACKHAVHNKLIKLVYGTPDGDVTVSVKRKNGKVVIRINP